MPPSLSARTHLLGDILSIKQASLSSIFYFPENRAFQRPSNLFSSVEPRRGEFCITFRFIW